MARSKVKQLFDIKAIEEAIPERGPISTWGGRCHEMSLAVLRTGLVGEGRVARGRAEGVMSQHSWIVLGYDCYDRDATIVDPTVWSAWDPEHPHIWTGKNLVQHIPHGAGSIWHYGGKPPTAEEAGEEPVRLKGYENLTAAGKRFLEMCGPMGYKGYSHLAHGPMGGWPAEEIIVAIDATFPAMVPIDILGMVTETNPRELYRLRATMGHQ